MASGDPVVQIIGGSVPTTSPSTPDIYIGSTETIPVIDFADVLTDYYDYSCRLHGYGNGGLTFTIFWKASTSNTNDVVWGIAIRRIPDDSEDMDASHSYQFNQVTATAPTVLGEVAYTTVTFTNGADMDSWVDGEYAIVRVERDGSDAADDMSGDAELIAIFGEET